MEKNMKRNGYVRNFLACTKKLFPCLVLSLAYLALSQSNALARSQEEMCPTEKYDAVTVQGIFLGWQTPNSPDGTITVRLRDSHAPLHILVSETRARQLFNREYNAIVEVTYDFIQHYSRADKKCHQSYVLKTGKIIDEQKKSKFYH